MYDSREIKNELELINKTRKMAVDEYATKTAVWELFATYARTFSLSEEEVSTIKTWMYKNLPYIQDLESLCNFYEKQRQILFNELGGER
jgi:hypothetical protein